MSQQRHLFKSLVLTVLAYADEERCARARLRIRSDLCFLS